MKLLITLFLVPIFCSCTPLLQSEYPPTTSNRGLVPKSSFLLSQNQRDTIALKIWQNESSQKKKGLTAWNSGEDFPSLGIGHFIWYPKGVVGSFTESFPQFVRYALERGVRPPTIALSSNCPWKSRKHFKSEFNNPEMVGLRDWFANHLTLQADFIISKSQSSLDKLLRVTPDVDRARVYSNYQKVSTTPNGQYALIDYVNFKGEGINPKERYKDKGWGLLQALQEMETVPGGLSAAREFSNATKKVLLRRIANSPKGRGETRWKAGWINRCNTYKRPL